MKLHTLLCALLAGAALAAAEKALPVTPETYQPDFSESDIYLPYLKRTPLWGWWDVRKVTSDRKNDPNDEGTRLRFYAADYDSSGWEKDLVPNRLTLPISYNIPEPDWHKLFQVPSRVREWGGVAWLLKSFQAPERKPGERAILHFEEIAGAFTLYVNGKRIAGEIPYTPPISYKGPERAWDFDITDVLKPGQTNRIAVRLFHDGTPVRWGWAGISGIVDLVYLDIRPAAYTQNVMITTAPDCRTVEFEALLSGSSAAADTENWSGEIFEWNSRKSVATVRFGAPHKAHETTAVSTKHVFSNPKLWSPEHPFLYGIRIRNARGELTGIQRFGIRTFGIKDGHFVLNGQPIMLRGVCGHDPSSLQFWKPGNLYSFRTNRDGTFYKYWKYFRDAHVNHLRFHGGTFSRPNLDMLDELGILLTYELSYPETMIQDPSRVDLISVKGYDGACDRSGKLLPGFVDRVKYRIRTTYSHPVICTYSFGNELCTGYDDPRMINMLNNLYDLYAKTDKQRRPVTNSSGRAAPEATQLATISKYEKTDYLDMHDYSGSLRQTPFFYGEEVFRNYLANVLKYYGKKLPIVNGEFLYYFYGNYKPYRNVWKSDDADEPDWEAAKFIFNGGLRKQDVMMGNLSFYWCRNFGTRAYQLHHRETRTLAQERILELQRKNWPDLNGFEALSDFIEIPDLYPNREVEFARIPEWHALARGCAPVIPILDRIHPNNFCGEEFRTSLFVINNAETAKKNLLFEAEIRDAKGRILRSVRIPAGDFASGERKNFPFAIRAPETEGAFRLVYRLRSGKEMVLEREMGVNVRNRKTVFAPIETKKKIGLYDASSLFGGMKPYSTAKVLKMFRLPYKTISDFDSLGKYDVLIIGNNSIDQNIQENAEKIRSFVENGGRLLVFDQNFVGRIPFLSELEYVPAGPVEFTEILKRKHPLVAGMRQEELYCWKQADASVYRSFIMPVSEAAVMVGANTTVWGSTAFGMTAAHLKLGKGDILFVQPEVTKTLTGDSGAAALTRNTLSVILDDATREKAVNFHGKTALKASPLPRKNALCIPLTRAANMAFADSVAADGKGGWTDQGPTNDLSPFPLGQQIFIGIPFTIADPQTSGGRSCLVVADRKESKIRKKSGTIPVGAQVKRLLFLHAGAYLPEIRQKVGSYTIRFRSGQQTVIPLISGENIADWWNAPTSTVSRADCAWSASNRSGVVGLFLFEWKNPRPEDPVESITLTAGNSVIGLAGITGEKYNTSQTR